MSADTTVDPARTSASGRVASGVDSSVEAERPPAPAASGVDLSVEAERPPAPAASGVDVKPRSRVVTDGLEATASRGMLRAVGMGDEDWEKPQVGVASSWNEITPCNLSLDRLAGSVLLAGCDKSLPGMLMAAARLDLASVFLYAGSIMPGRVGDKEVTIIDAFEAVGACGRRPVTPLQVAGIEK